MDETLSELKTGGREYHDDESDHYRPREAHETPHARVEVRQDSRSRCARYRPQVPNHWQGNVAISTP